MLSLEPDPDIIVIGLRIRIWGGRRPGRLAGNGFERAIFVLELIDPVLPVLFFLGQALILGLELELTFGSGPLEDRGGRRRRCSRRLA
jgi:hypothetical protein